ncbi:DUF3383 family protein [Paenibacillus sp. L3-i20]|uniref:DUF3383 family protein n=1 Tax=Paenibacillus sp. L3-i20 TaxID=2905833 RepID=UPI001EDF0159|nr:DUF3383 family protein [Paenibacillus sp. L3-i20]GKU78562.1 hypothetical protein L3i20_v229590 [Paenibacillus sp. L3-i20]
MSIHDVIVTIDIQKPTPKLSFGKTLIIGSSETGQDYKSYANLEAVKLDFASTSEIYKAAFALFNQGDNAPTEIAVMLHKTAGETLEAFLPSIFSKDWYFLVSTSGTVGSITTIADAVELEGSRQFVASSSNKTELAAIKAKGYSRTSILYHTDTSNYPEAAWIGETGSDEVGSATWKFKTLRGIVPLDLTATELNEIHELGANTYVMKAGKAVTSEGKVASGEYIDIVHSKDYLIQSIEFAVQDLLNQTRKLSYDDTGIALIESSVRTVLQRAFNSGMVARDEKGMGIFSTTFKSRNEVDAADRANRLYDGGEFSFELAGAIHKTAIKGYIKI